MNKVELTEHRILVSLFVDAHRPTRRYVTRQDLNTDYHVESDTRLFNSIVADLRARKLAKAVPDRGAFGIRLHGDAYKEVLALILDTLAAETFEVDWKTKRILTDADEGDHDNLIPCPNGWMLLTCEKKGQATPANGNHPSGLGQFAGRDINQFFGPVHGHGVDQRGNGDGEGCWARWGTIFGGVSAVVAITALIAAWYFWSNPVQ